MKYQEVKENNNHEKNFDAHQHVKEALQQIAFQ
jgi:hypothetical protein